VEEDERQEVEEEEEEHEDYMGTFSHTWPNQKKRQMIRNLIHKDLNLKRMNLVLIHNDFIPSPII